MDADVVVVGGGPAGLTAATSAARQGARVVLVDERPAPGGSLLGQLYETRRPDGGSQWMTGSVLSAQLAAAAAEAGVRILSARAVWGIWPGWTVHVCGMNGLHGMKAGVEDHGRILGRALILATGSTERSYVLPNWTLPGVMTFGAIQSLLHVYRLAPGTTAIIVGADHQAILAARQLTLAGMRVRGVLLPPPGTPGGKSPGEAIEALTRFAGTAASLELDHVGRLLQGYAEMGSAADFPPEGVEAWNVPIMLRRALLAVRGDDRVTAVEVCDLTASGEPVGRPEMWDVDTVVLAAGVSPLVELPQIIGCQVAYVPELGGTVPVYGPQLEATIDGVFLAGSMLGMEDTSVAIAQGRLAGLAACARLGVLEGAAAVGQLRSAEQALESTRRSASPLLPKVNEGHRRVHELWCRGNANDR